MKANLYLLFIVLNGFNGFSQNGSAEKIYRRVNDAVVRIFTQHDDQTMHAQASGVILKQQGWIITNYHVLGDASSIYAEHKGLRIKLDSVIAIDPGRDILILHVSKEMNPRYFRSLPNIKVGNSNKLKVGQKVYAIGSPMGFENTITEGIISGLRTASDSKSSLIQISAPISSGSSGGAVLDAKGQLIGISTLVITGKATQNLNFALPVNDVMNAGYAHIVNHENAREKSVEYYYQKGFREYMSKHYLSAIINYEKAIKADGDTRESGILYYYMGLAYHKMGSREQAIKYYNKSLDKIKIADTYIGLAAIYTERKEFEHAIRNYELSIELVPEFTEGYIGLGNLYFLQKDFSKALYYLKKAITLNPGSYNAHYLLGKISMEAASYEHAIYFFKQAIEFNQEYAEAYLALAEIYIRIDQPEKAIPYQQRAYQLKPTLRTITD